MRVERVPLEELLPRRLALLRSRGHPAEWPKPGDLHPQAAHLGVREDGRLVAFASIHPTDVAGEWQLRAEARGSYERLGFSAVGDAYEVPVTGPHLRMEIGL